METDQANSAREREAAKFAHDGHLSGLQTTYQSVVGYGDTAIKGGLTINGGAAIASLAFIGTILTHNQPHGIDFSPLVAVLQTFGNGVLAGAMAGAFAYLAQFSYHWDGANHTLHYDYPFVRPPRDRWLLKVALICHVASVVLVVFSWATFLSGGLQFAKFARHAIPIIATAQEKNDQSTLGARFK